MRLIDADRLLDRCKFYHLPNGDLAVPIIDVQHAPTIEPQQRWIPVSETVDIPEHEVLACDKYGTELIGFLYEKDEQWMCESDECIMYDVVAWQQLPSPYKQE